MAREGDRSAWEALRALPLGQRVAVTDPSGRRWRGTVIPPHDLAGERILTLKLESGYNVGIRIGPGTSFQLEAGGPTGGTAPADRPAAPSAGTAPADGIALLTTGGTIASRVDYATGGVRPVPAGREILEFYPELEANGPVRVEPVFDRMSEDLAPADWLTLAERTAAAFRDGARGVVIAHGTDTLGFTAAALAFLLPRLPGPVVLVGAQRSPDRPSSDGPSNLAAAATLARDGRLGEVVAVLHAGLSDDRFAIHRGVWVRKMHSSRRDAFESRNGPVLGWVSDGRVELSEPVRPPAPGPPVVDGPIDPRAALFWSHPGVDAARLARYTESLRGVVLAGTGLGHVSADLVAWARSAVAGGTVVAMTTQCLAGPADPFVYSTGRALLGAGVTYLGDLLPETAYAKMLWALGHATDPAGVRARLREDRAGEFSERHRPRSPP